MRSAPAAGVTVKTSGRWSLPPPRCGRRHRGPAGRESGRWPSRQSRRRSCARRWRRGFGQPPQMIGSFCAASGPGEWGTVTVLFAGGTMFRSRIYGAGGLRIDLGGQSTMQGSQHAHHRF